MEIKKIVPAPFTKGVNFSNWLEHRPADEIYADMFSRQDFVNVKKLGCDVIRLPIHFERFCRREEDYRIHEKILTILDNVASWAGELGDAIPRWGAALPAGIAGGAAWGNAPILSAAADAPGEGKFPKHQLWYNLLHHPIEMAVAVW